MTGKDFRIRFGAEVETTNAVSEIDNLISAQRQKLADALKLDIKLDSQKIDSYFNNLSTKISASVSELNNLERIMTQVQLDSGKRINITSSLSATETAEGSGEYTQALERTNYRTQAPSKDTNAIERMKSLFKELEVAQREVMSGLRANDNEWAENAKKKISQVRSEISSLAFNNPEKFTAQDMDEMGRSSYSMDSQIDSMEKMNGKKLEQDKTNKQLLSTLEKHRQLVMDIQNMEQKGYRGPELEQYKSQLKSVNDELTEQYGNNKEMASAYVKQTEAMAEKSKLQNNMSMQDKKDDENLKQLKDTNRDILKYEVERANVKKEIANNPAKNTENTQEQLRNLDSHISALKEQAKTKTDLLQGTKNETEAIKTNAEHNERLKTAMAGVNAQGSLKKSWLADIKSGFADATARVIDYTIAYRSLWMVIQKFQESIQIIFNLNKAFTDIQMVTGFTSKQIYDLAESYSNLAIQMGTTIKDVAEGSSEWLRQGKTIAETNELLKQSMILSKIGAMGSAEASTALIAIMNGYKMATADAAHVVDSLTAVDMTAATSADELRKALQRTANTARDAGVEYDALVGYVGAVSEATRLAPERIGTAFKGIFSRLNSVRAGKFLSEDGEALNDVEKVLNKIGIKLRENENDWRNAGSVIDDVASKWESYTDKERNAISTAMAGTTQKEIFLSLMDNYKRSLELTETSLNSNGQAAKKYDIYLQNLEASLAKLQSTFEKFVFGEDKVQFFKVIIDSLQFLVKNLNTLVIGGGLVAIPMLMEKIKAIGMAQELNRIVEATSGLTKWQSAMLQNFSQLTPSMMAAKAASLGLSQAQLQELLVTTALTEEQKAEVIAKYEVALANGALNTSTMGLATSLKALWVTISASPLFWIVAAGVAFTAIVSIVDELSKSLEKAQEELKKTSDVYKQTVSDLEKMKDELEKNNKQIDILNSKGTPTLIEESEIKKLRDANIELQHQINLLKIKSDNEAKEVNKDVEKLGKSYNRRTSDIVTRYYSDFGDSEARSSDKKELIAMAENYQDLIDKYVPLNKEQEKYLDGLKKQRNEILKLVDPLGFLNTEFDKIKSDSKNIESLSRIYSEISDLSFADFSSKFVDDFSLVKKWADDLGVSAEDLYEHLQKLSKAPPPIPQFDFEKGIKDVSEKVSDLKSAYDEINNSGELSIATLSKLIASDESWSNALIDKDGNIINDVNIFKQSVQDNIATMKKDLDARRAYLTGLLSNKEALVGMTIEEAVARKKELIDLESQAKFLEALSKTDLFAEKKSDKKSKADAEISNSKYAYEMGEISEAQHFKNLERIRDKYFKKGSDEWKQYALEIKQYQDKVRLETLKEQEDDYKKAANAVTKILEDQKKKIEDKYNAEIDALKNLNTQKEKDLSLEKARLALTKAQTEETRMVFVKGQGFIRKKDETAIKDAQDEVDKLTREQQIADLEVKRDSEVKVIQDKIDIWKSISDEFTNAEDKAMAQKLLGVNWENDIFNNRLDNFRTFRDKYLQIQQSILDAEALASGKPAINILQYAKSYANGGLMDYTGVANIHGSPDRPEIALNNSQAAGLYNWIKSLSYPSMSNVTPKSASKSGGDYIFKDIKIYPNDFDDFVKQIRTKANVTGR